MQLLQAKENSRSTSTIGRRPPHLKQIQSQELAAEAIRLMLHLLNTTKNDCSGSTWRPFSGPRLLVRKGGKRRRPSGSRMKLLKKLKGRWPRWLRPERRGLSLSRQDRLATRRGRQKDLHRMRECESLKGRSQVSGGPFC